MKNLFLLLPFIFSCSSPSTQQNEGNDDSNEIEKSEVIQVKEVTPTNDAVSSVKPNPYTEKLTQTNDSTLVDNFIKGSDNQFRTTYQWGNYTFLLGYFSVTEDETFDNPGYLLVLENGELVDSIHFKGYEMLFMEHLGNKGLGDNYHMFYFKYGLEACDYPNDYTYFAFDTSANSIIPLAKFNEGGNEYAGLWHEFIFPNDSAGVDNQVTIVKILSQRDEETDAQTKTFDSAVYTWEASSFSLYKDFKGWE